MLKERSISMETLLSGFSLNITFLYACDNERREACQRLPMHYQNEQSPA